MVDVTELKRWRDAEPFRPFRILLNDGREALIRHPSNIGWSAEKQLVMFASDQNGMASTDFDNVKEIRPAVQTTDEGIQKADLIRSLRLAYPFRPFLLIMKDGRRFLIDKPFYVGISPLKNVILVATEGEKVEMLRPEWVKEAIFADRPMDDSGELAG